MQDISDKELDQFFKNSIEQPDIPFNEEAWGKMEQSLNKHDQKQRVRKYRNYAILGIAVYVLSTVSVHTLEYADHSYSPSYLSSSQETSTSSSPTIVSAPSVVGKNTTVVDQTKSAAMENATNSSEASIETSATIEKEKEGKKYSTVEKRTRERKYNKSETYIARAKQEQPVHSSTEKIKGKETDAAITETNITDHTHSLALSSTEQQPTSTLSPEQETKNTRNTNSKETTEFTQRVTNDNALALTADATLQILPTDSLLPLASQTSKDSTLPKDKAPLRRRFSFGIFASPDYSITSSAQFVSPGLSLGLFLEYHINRRFTIFTGVMRSSKIYSSNGTDYTATDRYWAYKGMTSRIDGSCVVVDVPLNIKYHFYNRDKNLLFASAGLSSYFMLNEQYRFKYSDTYYADRFWSYDTKRNYFFGIVNASVGYERYISKSFSVQVEPFVKIPLGTIGDGQVKLLTTGMFFYLKYSIH